MSANSNGGYNIKHLRNIAIIAHIDAGKTTLTERMLYYSGLIHKVGEVHHGTTTTDYLQEERDRGITIVSSVIQLSWSGYKINLIDTPGHLDFNPEVEKSLCVLEGAVVAIDASEGVEPQTECVWVQARRYNVSCIIFINKMDKVNADFKASVASLSTRLSNYCVPIVHPIYDSDGVFCGFFDLVMAKKRVWPDKSHEYVEFDYDQFSDGDRHTFDSARDVMLESLSSRSDAILEKLIEEQPVTSDLLLSEVIRLVGELKLYPILCGTAFHNKGVQTVLDYICRVLPSPDKNECSVIDLNDKKEISVKYDHKALIAFVFKVVFDSYSGYIAYTRVYCGVINVGDYIYNSRLQKKVRVQSIIRFHAADKKQISTAYYGDVVGLVCDDLVTADTLCDVGNSMKISKIVIPDSVVEISITPKTKEDQDKFGKYIHIFMREDPTIKLRFDPESHSTCLNGVGSLQLEILLSRMFRQYGVCLEASKPRVTYRETITKEVRVDYLLKKQTGGAGRYAGVTIIMSKYDKGDKEYEFVDSITKGAIPRQYIPEIFRGFQDALCSGVLTKSPVINVRIELIDGKHHPVDSSNIAFYAAGRASVHEGLLKAACILLEPINFIVLYTSNEYLSKVIGSIYSKRGSIKSVTKDCNRGDEFKIVEALMPMQYIFDYADEIRGLTKGTTAFVYKFHSYKPSSSFNAPAK